MAEITRAQLIVIINSSDYPRLSGTDLSGLDMSALDLRQANLFGANLSGACLSQAILWKANLSSANLRQADLRYTNLQHARLNGADIAGARLDGALLDGAWHDSQTKWPVGFNHERLGTFGPGADMRGVYLEGQDLRGADLCGANLEGANLFQCSLAGGRLEQANLRQADLRYGNLKQANLQGANLQGARLFETNLERAVLVGANLKDAAATAVNLTEADMRGANLEVAKLAFADLTDAKVTAEQLSRALELAAATLPDGTKLDSDYEATAWRDEFNDWRRGKAAESQAPVVMQQLRPSQVSAVPTLRRTAGGLVIATPENLAHLLRMAEPPQRVWWETAEMELRLVPGGEFLMGITAEQALQRQREFGSQLSAHMDRVPVRPVDLDTFLIGTYPVTIAQYARFVQATGWPVHFTWDDQRKSRTGAKANHPVVYVSWHDAAAFCEWAGLRLPTEEEWEKAAGWDPVSGAKRRYPWGDEWDRQRCNTAERWADREFATSEESFSWREAQMSRGTTTVVGF